MSYINNIFIFYILFLRLISYAEPSIFSYIKDNTYCRLSGECCSEKFIPADFNKLYASLKEKVYGQDLAQKLVIDALKAHWNSPHTPKALTLSFHGSPGVGKNYISKFIKESIYANGALSNYVHHFMGRIHFPLEDKTEEYKSNLYQWIKGNVSICPYSLFVFDEVDKMPPKILDVIKPMIDYNDNVDKIDYRKSVFIFLSNTGGSMIKDRLEELWREGKRRHELRIKDFELLIAKGAFNEKGGFQHSDTIRSNLIDHYIPFLPLELEHVRLCIQHAFMLRGVKNPPEEAIEEVLEYVEWGPWPSNRYSNTGCKRLSQKVAAAAHNYRGKDEL